MREPLHPITLLAEFPWLVAIAILIIAIIRVGQVVRQARARAAAFQRRARAASWSG